MTPKLLIVQSVVGGPWCWAIVHGRKTLAVSPKPFKRLRHCSANATWFVKAMGKMKIENREIRPAVQLSLFPVEV